MEPLILQADSEDAGKRLDAWLAEQTELTRSAAQKLAETGRVTAAGKPLAKNTRLTGRETISVLLPEPEAVDLVPQDIPLDVVYEDDDVIVVNKPKGLVVHCCTTAAVPSPASTGSCAPALSTALTGIPPALSLRRRTTLPMSGWRHSFRVIHWPGHTAASSWGISGRMQERSTLPSAAVRQTGRRWPWWPAAGMP